MEETGNIGKLEQSYIPAVKGLNGAEYIIKEGIALNDSSLEDLVGLFEKFNGGEILIIHDKATPLADTVIPKAMQVAGVVAVNNIEMDKGYIGRVETIALSPILIAALLSI